jgi:hypothetical protein
MAKYPFTKACQLCTNPFEVKSARYRKKIYCSNQCSAGARRTRAREIHCLNCGVNLDNQFKFCCQSCAATYNNKHRGPRPTDTKLKIKKSVLECAGISLEERIEEELVPCKVWGGPKKHSQKYYCSKACMKVKRTPMSPEERKRRNAESQSRYRQKKYRCLAPDANREMIKEIYRACPAGYEVDHIIPLSKGGLHHQDNLQYLPKHENRKKSNKIINESV